MTSLEAVKMTVRNEQEENLVQLKSKIQALGRDCNSVLVKLDYYGLKALINPCGEVQSLGREIDMLCHEWGCLREQAERLATVTDIDD
jgi:hypothetical protein